MMLLLRLPGGEQGGPGVQRRQQRRRRGRRRCCCCAGLLLLLCACCTGALLQQVGVFGPAGGGSSGQEALAIRGALVRCCSDPALGRVREPVTAQAAAAAQGLLDSESRSLKAKKALDQIWMERRNVGRVIGRRSAGASEVLSLPLSRSRSRNTTAQGTSWFPV